MIAAQSIVDVQLTSDTGFSTADSVLQQASSQIAADGRFQVVSSAVINSSLYTGILNAVTSLNPDQPFQADIQVLCLSAFAQASDVASIIANFFYTVTGNYPTSVSAVSVTPPGGNVGATGSPALSTTAVGGSSAAGGTVVNGISSLFSSLGTAGTNLLIGLAAIIILVLVLIAYGPNIGKIAKAV